MMDVALRVIAIFIEVIILVSVIYALLVGARLTIFDLGLGSKYKRVITMALILAGAMVVVFFIGHLVSFYPALSPG